MENANVLDTNTQNSANLDIAIYGGKMYIHVSGYTSVAYHSPIHGIAKVFRSSCNTWQLPTATFVTETGHRR